MSIRKGELIGLKVEVLGASDPSHVGVSGTVVDETMKTLTIEHGGKEKMIQKKGTLFRFEVRGGTEVRGEEILFRPEDRVKKAR